MKKLSLLLFLIIGNNLFSQEVVPPQQQEPQRVISYYTAEHTIYLKPNEGRIYATVKSRGLKSPESIKNADSNLSIVINKLNILGVTQEKIKNLKTILNDDYVETEIWGGATLRTVHRMKNGYASYNTLDIRTPKEYFQEALDIVTVHKNVIHSAGYSSSKYEEEVEKAKGLALSKALEKAVLFGEQFKVIGVEESVEGENIAPTIGVMMQITVKTKIKVEARQ